MSFIWSDKKKTRIILLRIKFIQATWILQKMKGRKEKREEGKEQGDRRVH